MRIVKWALALLIVAAAIAGARYILTHKPVAQPQRAESSDKPVPVETQRLARQDYAVQIASYGTIEPAREITLVAQVGGKITRVADTFSDGTAVSAAALLVQIDPADYRISVKTAEATLAQARATLAEQAALSEQAVTDWRRLGRQGEPSDLVARKPQLEAARAQVASAEAQLERARLDLARTEIRAPFDGYLDATNGDIGQYVGPGSSLGTLYASGEHEVRLPVSQRDLPFITTGPAGSPVIFTDRDTGAQFEGQLLRREATVDSRTRQLFVIAELNDADALLGQFVDAVIAGRTFSGVFPIERRYLRDDNTLLLAREGHASAVPVEIVWRDDRTALVTGPQEGDLMIITPLGPQADGLPIRLREDTSPAPTTLGDNT